METCDSDYADEGASNKIFVRFGTEKMILEKGQVFPVFYKAMNNNKKKKTSANFTIWQRPLLPQSSNKNYQIQTSVSTGGGKKEVTTCPSFRSAEKKNHDERGQLSFGSAKKAVEGKKGRRRE